jgi:hypothetical protein
MALMFSPAGAVCGIKGFAVSGLWVIIAAMGGTIKQNTV